MAMSPMPLCVEPTTHGYLLGEHLLSGLESVFPALPNKMKQAFLSSCAFLIVQEKSIVLHALVAVIRKLQQSCVVFTLKFWRSSVVFIRCGARRLADIATVTTYLTNGSSQGPGRDFLATDTSSSCSPGCCCCCGIAKTSRAWWCKVRGQATKTSCLA